MESHVALSVTRSSQTLSGRLSQGTCISAAEIIHVRLFTEEKLQRTSKVIQAYILYVEGVPELNTPT